MTHWDEISEYIKIQNESYQNRCPKLYTLLYENEPTHEVKTCMSTCFDESRLTIDGLSSNIKKLRNDFIVCELRRKKHKKNFIEFIDSYPFNYINSQKMLQINNIVNSFVRSNECLVIAGGSVTKNFIGIPLDEKILSDIDFYFISGYAKYKISKYKSLIRIFANTLKEKFVNKHKIKKHFRDGDSFYECEYYLKIITNGDVINIIIVEKDDDYILIKFQFILTVYRCIGNLLYDFDLGSCQMAYTGHEIIASPLCVVSLKYKINILNENSFKSYSYPHRIFKYMIRGFKLVIPEYFKMENGETIEIGFGFIKKLHDCYSLQMKNIKFIGSSTSDYLKYTNFEEIAKKISDIDNHKYKDPNFENIKNYLAGKNYYSREYNRYELLYHIKYDPELLYSCSFKYFVKEYFGTHLLNLIPIRKIKEIYEELKKVCVIPVWKSHIPVVLSLKDKEQLKCEMYTPIYKPKVWRPEMLDYIDNKSKVCILKAQLIVSHLGITNDIAYIICNKILNLHREEESGYGGYNEYESDSEPHFIGKIVEL